MYSFIFWALFLTGFFIFSINNVNKTAFKSIEKGIQPKNIILFTADALRCDFTYKKIPGLNLPNINRFKNDSVYFTNYFSVSGSTSPSFASLFTGKTPVEHGVSINGYVLDDKTNYTLAELLNSYGYRTAGFSENVSCDSGLAQGFQYFYHKHEGWSVNGKARNFKGALENIYYRIKKRIHGNDIVSLATKWIKNNKKNPFFIWIHIYDTHLPYNPPKKVKYDFIDKKSRYQFFTSNERWRIFKNKIKLAKNDIDNIRNLYTAEVKSVDNRFGILLKYLKNDSIYDNAMIIFSSDHGENLYEKDFWIGHGFLHDMILRIPLIVKLPESKKIIKNENQSFFSNMFLAQTILDVIEIKEKFSSLSMIECFKGKDKSEQPAIISFRYDGYKANIKLAELSIIDGTHKVVSNGKESQIFRLSDLKENQEFIWDDTFTTLKQKIFRQFSEFAGKTRTQIITLERLKQLKTLGYIN